MTLIISAWLAAYMRQAWSAPSPLGQYNPTVNFDLPVKTTQELLGARASQTSVYRPGLRRRPPDFLRSMLVRSVLNQEERTAYYQ